MFPATPLLHPRGREEAVDTFWQKAPLGYRPLLSSSSPTRCCVTENGLELLTLLPPYLKCCHDGHTTPSLSGEEIARGVLSMLG